jgi:mono/diheme cytochrome c family protein
MRTAVLGLVLVVSAGSVRGDDALADAKRDSARRVGEIFRAKCHRCHGQDGAVEGGLNYILDFKKLVGRRKVVPGRPDESRLLQRLTSADNPMPPASEAVRPSADEIDLVKKWIADGAPTDREHSGDRRFITELEVVDAIRSDLDKAAPIDRGSYRYFTITHLYNAGALDDELGTYRVALSKLVNSLSWSRAIKKPTPIDAAGTILRIDLRDYRWTARTWERILASDPYGLIPNHESMRSIARSTGTVLPWVRGDWFVRAASRPPLYHDVLQLPRTERELERLVGVDVAADLARRKAARAGFNGSGIARNNRIVERHQSPFGAYWKTYDFATGLDRQNVFANPLGPGREGRSFRYDAGEIIFDLPNGMHGYYLANSAGVRIDEGPVTIVSVKNRPDPRVITGVSCMSCHARGLIPKSDQVRSLLDDDPRSFLPADARTIKDLYPPDDEMQKLFRHDTSRYIASLEQTGVNPKGATEPVEALALRFDLDVDLETAAVESGLPPAEFLKGIERSPALARDLGPLRITGGTVSRQVSLEVFPRIVRELRLGSIQPRGRDDRAGPVARNAGRNAQAFSFGQANGNNNGYFFYYSFGDGANFFNLGAPGVRNNRANNNRAANNRFDRGDRAGDDPARRLVDIEPAIVVDLDAAIADQALDRARRKLIVLDQTRGVLHRFDIVTRKLDDVQVNLGANSGLIKILLGDDSTAYVVGKRRIFAVDVDRFRVIDEFEPGIEAFDADRDAHGRLFLTSAERPRAGFFGAMSFLPNYSFFFSTGAPGDDQNDKRSATVDIIDPVAHTTLARFDRVPAGTFARVHPTRNRLYLGISRDRDDANVACIAFDSRTRYASSSNRRAALGGKFEISPDGRYLIDSTGSVLELDERRNDDLALYKRITAHLDSAIDPPTNRLFVSTKDGSISIYSYPQFAFKRTIRIGGRADRILVDPATRSFFAAVLPADEDRNAAPKAELRVYDLDAFPR